TAALCARELAETGLGHGPLPNLEALDQGGIPVVTNSVKAATRYRGCRNKPEVGHARKADNGRAHAASLAMPPASLPMRSSARCTQMSSERSVRAPLAQR